MAVIAHGGSLPDSSDKSDFYNIIDTGTVKSIVDADISSGAAIQDSKLATITTANKVNVSSLTGQIANANLAQITAAGKVSGSSLVLLGNIPASAGFIPAANISGAFGTWASKTVGTTYQATTDGLVVVLQNCTTLGGGTELKGFTDSNSSPATERAGCSTVFPSSTQADHTIPTSSFMMPVKKGDYYLVTRNAITNSGSATDSATVTMYFLPLGG